MNIPWVSDNPRVLALLRFRGNSQLFLPFPWITPGTPQTSPNPPQPQDTRGGVPYLTAVRSFKEGFLPTG